MAIKPVGKSAILKVAFFAAFFFVSPFVFATIEHGTYSDASSAVTACNAFAGGPWCQNGNTVDGIGNKQICAAFDGYPYDCHAFRYYVSGVCEDGLEPDDVGLCVEPPDPCGEGSGAASGSFYNDLSESCECPEGSVDYFGSDASYSCVPVLPECEAGSSQHIGYIGDQPVCDYNGFCDSGESGGFADTGSGSQWVCVPDACSGGLYINGVCYSGDDTTVTPSERFDGPDTDGDGVPDSEDDDIDGDGIQNAQDSDRDGDGVSNDNEVSDHDEGTASASGGCAAPPVCTGDDPQECAILKQQWYAMCFKPGDFKSPEGSGFSSAAQDRFDNARTNFDSLLTDIGSQISDKLDFGINSGSGALPHDQRNILNGQVDFSLARWAGDLVNIGNILFFACCVLAAGIILRR